ncbi:MAG: xylose ABC transporter ATP-binding protein [Bdellovibrionota bacterium]
MNLAYALEMKNIEKKFGPVTALSEVNFCIKKGEIHALCGENGAGKSTLMKILSGFYPNGDYEGEVFVNGILQKFHNTTDSERVGISIIYQELALVKELSICENIFLGHEKTKRGFIDWNLSHSLAKDVLKQVNLNMNPSTKISELGIGEQQLVEIAKAIAKNANILILDEPTAALTESEADNLLNILKELKKQGKTCIYISHRLKEIFQIADSVTILRDGKTVSTHLCSELNEEKLVTKMVGRELTNIYPRKELKKGPVAFEVKNWTVKHPETGSKILDDINFSVHEGEILGIAGLMGSGRTELVTSLFGAFGVVTSGSVCLDGKKLNIKREADAIAAGIGLVSEDRKKNGLVLGMDIKQNTTLASLRSISNFGLIDDNKEIFSSRKYVRELGIKTNSIEQYTGNLSGGNQQKVVLSKWLMTNPRVLILDEPTRGIDVGAKYEIYSIINHLLQNGVCIIMISSELPEVLGMSHRVIVMHEGKINGEFHYQDASQEKIMHCATGTQFNTPR